jgi:hypothetical protein
MRLTGVALLAPTAAALLAGSVTWATAHEPGRTTVAAGGVPSVRPGASDSDQQRRLREVAQLREQVELLRKELGGLPKVSGTPSSRRPGPARTTKPPARKPARTVPPPVQATTGAS